MTSTASRDEDTGVSTPIIVFLCIAALALIGLVSVIGGQHLVKSWKNNYRAETLQEMEARYDILNEPLYAKAADENKPTFDVHFERMSGHYVELADGSKKLMWDCLESHATLYELRNVCGIYVRVIP